MSTQKASRQKSPSSAKKGSEIRLVARVSTILRVLADNPHGLSLGAIAKLAHLPRGTVQRLVDALAEEGLAAKGPADASIRLGSEVARLGMTITRDLRQFYRRFLEEVLAQANETVDLTIFSPAGAVVIDQMVSPHALRVVSHPGEALPLNATASGKAHLSQLDRNEAIAVLRAPLRRYTRATTTDPDKLLQKLSKTMPGEVFIDREEYVDGICAVAIDLGVAGLGNVALSIPMPASRFDDSRERCSRALIALRERLKSRSVVSGRG